MPNIRIDLDTLLVNGQSVTFKSPADCSQVTGLIVYYPENDSTVSKTFQFADAHGNNVGSVSLFAENVLVKVILHTELNRAYVQNADTNKYIEETFLKRSGGDMGGHRITGLPIPQSGSEPATKEFVENFTVEGSTYVATDDDKDGNIVLRPYVADADELEFRDHIKNKNNPHMITPEQIKAVSLEGLRKLAYSQTDANGAITKALISSYPTSPGVYRVGDNNAALGIPDSWGTLIIFDGGGFIAHVFVNGSGMWFAKTDETYKVTTWRRVPWNPAFTLGTEYLTPENWNNCAVYKKWLNLGKLGAAGSTISVAHGITRTWIIGIRGIAVKQGGTAMEMVNGCGNGSVFVQDDKLQWHCILDLSSYNGYVEITYTKV